MSTYTFFNALERMSNEHNKSKKNKKIIIPDYFLKLLLNNKSILFKDQLNTNSLKQLISNRNSIKKDYMEPKYPDFCLANHKYKSLEKNYYNSEKYKNFSTLPKISEKNTLLNLRYQENPRNYEKYKNIGKEAITIKSKYNNSIQAESIIPNKNVNKFYFINKKINKNENIKINNNSSNDNYLHHQNMTFLSPLPTSMLSRNGGRINNIDEMLLKDLNHLLFNNYFKNNINKQIEKIRNKKKSHDNENDNENDNDNEKNKIINVNNSDDNIKNNNTKRNLLYNTINNFDIYEYNYYKTNLNNRTIKIDKEKNKNINKKLISVIDKSNNFFDNNNLLNKVETPQRKLLFNKKNINDYQINIKPLKFFNSFSSTSSSLTKIHPQLKNIPLTLLSEFKHKYTNPEEIQQKLSKEIIYFPLNSNMSPNNSKETYYYFINKMYRNQFIEYMKHRTNWELITKSNNDGQKTINFAWKYMSNRINFKNYKYEQNKPNKKLRVVNLFERNYEVGNKKNMFINLINYCDKININAFNLVPFTIIINNTKDVDYSLEALSDIINFVNKNKNINGDLITNKKYNEHFWFDKNFEALKKQYININKNFISEKNYWILKPTDLYQGKCIEICNSFEEISKKCRNMFKGVEKKFIPELVIKEEEISDDEIIQNINSSKILTNNNEENNNNNTFEYKNNNTNSNINNSNKKKIAYSKMYCSNEIIIQKYLDRPLLYYKRKFDIRCFVLVDSNLNVFFCREGHLKGSSEFYDLNNTNKLIHITNYSLQKKSSKFEQFEDGNEISYNDFKKYMEKKSLPLYNFNNMINQMKYLVEISFKSVGKKLIKTNPVLCFEIFGYDFIIDNDFKPWILEINNNPGLCISSPVIQKLVPRMLDDAFRLTIDKVFETRYSQDVIDSEGKYKSKYELDGFSNEENIFEFLCNVN